MDVGRDPGFSPMLAELCRAGYVIRMPCPDEPRRLQDVMSWKNRPELLAAPAIGAGRRHTRGFRLWVRIVIADEFILRSRHAATWAVLAAGLLLSAYGGATWSRIAPAPDLILHFAALGLALLAAVQSMATWRGDLVTEGVACAPRCSVLLHISMDAIYGRSPGSLVITPPAIACRTGGIR
jgi:hypothetical protein